MVLSVTQYYILALIKQLKFMIIDFIIFNIQMINFK